MRMVNMAPARNESSVMNRKNVVYFDLLNILACLCVIGMHCNGIVHYFENTSAWRRSLVVEVLGYWAVPGFCMLSGATMMNYRERYSTGTFIKRRLMKVGIPLVVWTVIFYIWKRYTGSIVWTGFRDFINMIMNFQVEGVYWFFAPLLMIYISLPVLSEFSNDRNILRYMIIVGVTTISVLPLVCNLVGLSYNGHFYFPLTGGYLIYPLIGYYLHTTQIKPCYRIIIYLSGIVGVLVRYIHTAYTLTVTGTANTVTWGYTNLPALALAVAVFVLAKDISKLKFFENKKVQKLLRSMASASFGIYLIHIFIMNVIVTKLGVDMSALKWQMFGAFLVYFISLAIVKILQRIPCGKYIFP